MVRFRLDELLKARGWTDYKLAQESEIGANVIGKYRRNLVRQPDLRIVNRLCETLGCEIGELMEYLPDKKPKKRP
jgi:putative transcriptional regulator